MSATPWSGVCEPILVAASDSSFSRPHDLTLSPDRRLLYVADIGDDAVKVLHPDTLAMLGVIGGGRRGKGADRLNKPEGVEAVGDRVWVFDTYNRRILLYGLAGAP